MIRLGPPQPQLSPMDRWSMENRSRNEWLQRSFDGAVNAASPLHYQGAPGRLNAASDAFGVGSSAKGLSKIGPSESLLGDLTSPGNWADIGGRVLGAAGLGYSLYGASQAGNALDPVWDAARAKRGPQRARAFHRAGNVTVDSALAKGSTGAASGLSSGFAVGGPIGAAVGGLGAGLGSYGASLAKGMKTKESRSATLGAITPKDASSTGRSAANTAWTTTVMNNPLMMMDPVSAAYTLLAMGGITAGAKSLNDNFGDWRKKAGSYGKRVKNKLQDYRDKIL